MCYKIAPGPGKGALPFSAVQENTNAKTVSTGYFSYLISLHQAVLRFGHILAAFHLQQ